MSYPGAKSRCVVGTRGWAWRYQPIGLVLTASQTLHDKNMNLLRVGFTLSRNLVPSSEQAKDIEALESQGLATKCHRKQQSSQLQQSAT